MNGTFILRLVNYTNMQSGVFSARVCDWGVGQFVEFFLMRSVLSFLYPQLVTTVEGVCYRKRLQGTWGR